MDIKIFQQIIEDPGAHQRQIQSLMQKQPGLLVPYAKQIAPHVEFTGEFAQMASNFAHDITRTFYLTSHHLVRMLNAGTYQKWMDMYWNKDPLKSGQRIRMNAVGRCLATHLTRRKRLYELIENCYEGFVDVQDAVRAAHVLRDKPKMLTDVFARDFGKLPMDWWKEIMATPIRSMGWMSVIIQKLSWKKRAQLYSFLSERNRKFTALPVCVYGPEDLAIKDRHFGLIFNRKVGLSHKLNLLSDVQLIEGQLRGGKYLQKEEDKIKPKPKVPKYMYCPGSLTLQLKGEVLSDDQLKSLVLIMRAFAPLKVKNFMQGKEHLLGGTDTELGKDLTEWMRKGRIR